MPYRRSAKRRPSIVEQANYIYGLTVCPAML